ncbi:MAG: dihydroorotase [Deltaproteobacteria bacterium]|nr:dihydroorotase [Deltaproteobacteria bacterium]
MRQQPIVIRGATVVDPAQDINEARDILIEDGKVSALDKPFSIAVEGCQLIKAESLLLFPGLIDLHVHLRTPGHEYKEGLSSGLKSAAAGGFSSVLAMANTSPVIETAEQVASLLKASQSIKGARLYQCAALTKGRLGQELCQYDDLKKAGAVALSDDGSWVADSAVMRRALSYAQVFSLLPLSHSQDPFLAKNGQIREGRISARLGLSGIPSQAEEIAVFRDISLSALTKAPIHLCHISCAASLKIIARAKSEGLKVSCETAPHYLFLTDEKLLTYEANFKMNPPLGSLNDLEALREAILDGTIDAIATDHAPQSILEKETEFDQAAFGVIGLETALPLMLELSEKIKLKLSKLVELMSLNPARLLNIPGGHLKKGSPADLCLVDKDQSYNYDVNQSKSKSHNSPFHGRALKGRVLKTFVGGKIVYDYESNLS